MTINQGKFVLNFDTITYLEYQIFKDGISPTQKNAKKNGHKTAIITSGKNLLVHSG